MPSRAKQNLVILGAQWGDEGKAKMVDVLTEQVEVVTINRLAGVVHDLLAVRPDDRELLHERVESSGHPFGCLGRLKLLSESCGTGCRLLRIVGRLGVGEDALELRQLGVLAGHWSTATGR